MLVEWKYGYRIMEGNKEVCVLFDYIIYYIIKELRDILLKFFKV